MKQKLQIVFTLIRVAVDALVLCLAFFLAYALRLNTSYPPLVNPPRFRQYRGMLLIHVGTLIVTFFLSRLYHQKRSASHFDKFYDIFVAVSIGTIMSMAFTSFVYKNELDYPRLMVAYAWLLSVVLVIIGRSFVDAAEGVLWARYPQKVIIVGAGDIGHVILQNIRQTTGRGYTVAGFVDDEPASQGNDLGILGPIAQLSQIIEEQDAEQVIIGLPEADHDQLLQIISQCESAKVTIKVFPDLFQIMASEVDIDDFNGLPLLTVRDIQLRGWRLTLKRAMDLVISGIALIFLSPAMLLIGILIRLDSPGSVFYAQERMGLDAKPFMMIKFRSMRVGAEEDTGPVWAVKDDPRRTKIGAILRQLSLDELPQLINVLLGEMSLVGPRPERPVFVEQFKETIPRYMDRHNEKAGLTGWAQVNGLRGDTSIVDRTKYDLWYVENWSILLDFKIIFLTLFRWPNDKNAY
jgi:Undecaprenyl-phosphate glucose phosphotransferase